MVVALKNLLVFWVVLVAATVGLMRLGEAGVLSLELDTLRAIGAALLLAALERGAALARQWRGRPAGAAAWGVALLAAGTVVLAGAAILLQTNLLTAERLVAEARYAADPNGTTLMLAGGMVALLLAIWVVLGIGAALARPLLRRRRGAPLSGRDFGDGLVATYQADVFRKRTPQPELMMQQKIEPTYLAREKAVAEAVAQEIDRERGPRLLPFLPQYLMGFAVGALVVVAVVLTLDVAGFTAFALAAPLIGGAAAGVVAGRRGVDRIAVLRGLTFTVVAGAITLVPFVGLLNLLGEMQPFVDAVREGRPVWIAAIAVGGIALQAAVMWIGLRGGIGAATRTRWRGAAPA